MFMIPNFFLLGYSIAGVIKTFQELQKPKAVLAPNDRPKEYDY